MRDGRGAPRGHFLNCAQPLGYRFDLRAIGGSALTDDIDVPKKSRSSTPSPRGIPVTYVPSRNTIFLSLVSPWRNVYRRQRFLWRNQLDYSGYPDCRDEYIPRL